MKDLNELVELAKLANIAGQGSPEMVDFRVVANPDTIIAIAGAFRALEKRAEENQEVIEEYNAAMCASNEAGYAGVTAAQTIRHLMERAEAAEAKLAQREKIDEEAMHCATILEFIGNFESDDIDGDLVDLRFEIDGEDTGCDVSITEYALRSAKAIRSILSGASISRPAPAINLAELVPQPFDVFKQAGGVMVAVREGKTKNHLFGKGYNACIAQVINSIINSGELTRPDCEPGEARLCEILRKIEESK